MKTLTVTAKNDKTNDKGYHLWTTDSREGGLGGAVDTVTVNAGYLDIGEYVNITTLTIGASTGISLKGRLTSKVTNLDSGTSPLRDAGTGTTVSEDTGFLKVTLYPNGGTGTETTKWGIDGMYLTLPANTFTKTANDGAEDKKLVFLNWNTLTSPSDDVTSTSPGVGVSFADEGKVIVGVDPVDRKTVMSEIILYAQWSKLIGGTIFYVDASNGASYTFYDNSGNVVTYDTIGGVVGTSSALRSAVSYSVKGYITGMPDRFYVYNSNSSCKITGYFYENNISTTGTTKKGGWKLGASYSDGTTEEVVMADDNKGLSYYGNTVYVSESILVVGRGITNTRFYMNLGGTGSPSTTTYPELTRAKFAGDSSSIWYSLNTLNTVTKVAGYTDWYIPSISETTYLYKSGLTGVSSGSIGSSTVCYGFCAYDEAVEGVINCSVMLNVNGSVYCLSWLCNSMVAYAIRSF